MTLMLILRLSLMTLMLCFLLSLTLKQVSVCEHGNTAAAAEEEEQQDDDTSDSSTQKAPLREITAERSREIKLTLSDEHRNFLQTIVDKVKRRATITRIASAVSLSSASFTSSSPSHCLSADR